MNLLETTMKIRVDSEVAARDAIEGYRKEATEKGYTIKKASYEYKSKKSKCEIIDECWVVSVTQVFGSLWEV